MSKLATFRSRHKKNPGEPRRNGPIGSDIVEYIAPGFAAFAATRFLTRVAAVQIAKRWPRYAKHAGAIASVGSFAAAWLGAHRVKYLEKYHHPIVVGSGLAALQSLIQLYLPALGWMVSDASPELAATAAKPALAAGAATSLLPSTASTQAPVPPGFEETDANTWFSYNDAYDAGRYKADPSNPAAAAPADQPPSWKTSSAPAPDDQQIDALLDNSDMGLS
jgi:hypothetical protein